MNYLDMDIIIYNSFKNKIPIIYVQCFFRFSLKYLKKILQKNLIQYKKKILFIPYWVADYLILKKICLLKFPLCFSLYFLKSLFFNYKKTLLKKLCFRFLHFGILFSLKYFLNN
mmetsp:Transcript_4380/g.8777  ORF Transcript_4380/g.8777 Transcript_4380/m.8777 type:complete len:114 (+) Transcript_4380:547-888(+)